MYALPFFSFVIGGLFTLILSMTADVSDLDELNYEIPKIRAKEIRAKLRERKLISK